MSPKDSASPQPDSKAHTPLPVNVVDGIPDRSSKRGRWIYLLVAVAFCLWVAALVYIQISGRPGVSK